METWEIEFKDKLKQVEKLLQEAEFVLKRNGFQTPVQHPKIETEDKIGFPKGYIRTTADFESRYRFNRIINNKTIAKNLTYALQTSDVFNYFLNRFNISLSAGKIFMKSAIINILSIIEGILYGVAVSSFFNLD